MKDIISCVKTSSAQMENELTTLLEKKTYEEVKQIINKNQNICDGSLRQRKKKEIPPTKV